MDTGNYDAAELAFEDASKLIESGDSVAANILLDVNCGELNLQLGEVSKALACFERLRSQEEASLPPSISRIAEAGVGMCELHDGHFRRAAQRNDRLEFPSFWAFDPTLPVSFRARVLRGHGDIPGALAILRATAEQIETRFPLCWIKIRMEEIRILRGPDEASATQLARDVSKRAKKLGLTHQVRRIQTLL